MHDPSTVAHEILYPWSTKDKYTGQKRRNLFITIWHNDPLNFKGKCRGRDDDSCGWFSPLYTPAEREEYIELSNRQYQQLFSKQIYTREGKSYASAGYVATCYDAIYWSWRAIKAMGNLGWQYGEPLTPAELEEIYHLDSNPVDNLRHMFEGIQDEEEFQRFFFCVVRKFRAENRPWYRHPRWHIHHWSIQIHPWQAIRRRFWDKCDVCGKRGFPPGVYAMGDWGGKRLWHSACDSAAVCATPPAVVK